MIPSDISYLYHLLFLLSYDLTVAMNLGGPDVAYSTILLTAKQPHNNETQK